MTKISDLIEQLQHLKRKRGDIDVTVAVFPRGHSTPIYGDVYVGPHHEPHTNTIAITALENPAMQATREAKEASKWAA